MSSSFCVVGEGEREGSRPPWLISRVRSLLLCCGGGVVGQFSNDIALHNSKTFDFALILLEKAEYQ